jgi:hypothetical protein
MKSVVVFLVAHSLVAAAQDPTDLLLKIRQKVVATVERLPNYECRESVQRLRVTPPPDAPVAACEALANLRKSAAWSGAAKAYDQLAFDVAVSKDGEMYSRAGANQFTTDSPGALFGRGGLSSTGAFGIFLKDIFATEAASFEYQGDSVIEGKTLAKFSYNVPLGNGSYVIQNNSASAAVPYDGTFLVDPVTFDLVRLTVHPTALPKELRMCETSTTLDYEKVEMNGSEFLLPSKAVLHVLNADGRESENTMVFSGCHEFTSQSSVTFGGPETGVAASAKKTPARPTLPADQLQELAKIREQVMDTVNRLPKYLCTETIDRAIFRPEEDVAGLSCKDLAARRDEGKWKVIESQSDRLRLDVAVAKEEGEIYSWVGENKFHDSTLAELVGGGVTSTGAFSALLTAIFGGDSADFTYGGKKELMGRNVIEFGFRVPLGRSTYQFSNGEHRAIIKYEGTIAADSQTYKLMRLTVHSDDLPEALRSCDTTTVLDYSSVRLNNAEFLLPQNASLQLHYDSGRESENKTVFSGCHEFLGESTVSFDAPDESGKESSGRVAKPLVLPGGLKFVIDLARAIDTDTAAAGDVFEAKLSTPITGSHHEVLVPKGAKVAGRLLRVVRYYRPETLVVTVRLETIESGGAVQPFSARLATAIRTVKYGSGFAQNLGSFGEMGSRTKPADGILRFVGFSKGYVIERGMQMEGMTVEAK